MEIRRGWRTSQNWPWTTSRSRSGQNSLSATRTQGLSSRFPLRCTPELNPNLDLQAGYRDGITLGKQSRLQTGFDQGFNTTSPLARQVGSLRGIAASLLSLLTTASGAKHVTSLGALAALSPERREEIVRELRELVSALGRLDEDKVLPVDREAEDHARSHEDEGLSVGIVERRDLRRIEEALSGLGRGKAVAELGVQDCSTRLECLLRDCGLEGVLRA